jgi:predicted patatin/cPLA2 family phospholipase
MSKEMDKLQEQLSEALDKYRDWCKRIDNKEILFRNSKEEIDELDKEFKREIIMPIIAKIKWLQLNKNEFQN